MALVAPECFLGLSPQERRQQMYEAIYAWAGDETLTDPACFLGLSPEEGFVATVSAMQAPATDAVCLAPFQDQLRALYAVAYEKAGSDTLLAPDCLPIDLDEQEQALYAAFYSLSSQSESLTHPDNFLCLSPDERQLALFKVLSDLAGPAPEPEFNPADYGTVALWLKADALTGYEDEDVINTWPDSSGNGNDAAQGTFIQMPLYIASGINGRPCVRFDGIDDMLAPDVGVTFGPLFTWIAVARLLSAGNYPMLISQDSHNEMRWLSDTGRPEFEPLAAAVTAAGSTTGDWITFEVSASETTAELFVNGVSEGATGVTSGMRPITIGARAASLFAHMDLAELIMFSEQVSPAGMVSVRQYISGKYNLTFS